MRLWSLFLNKIVTLFLHLVSLLLIDMLKVSFEVFAEFSPHFQMVCVCLFKSNDYVPKIGKIYGHIL